jgi:perosamine synthetase
MEIAFGRPMIGEAERAAVMEVLSGPILVHGPRSTAFENEFAAWTGAPHAVSVSSCTAGMHLIWFSRGLGPGDEVIVPAQTHVATAHAVELTGARAVFVDVDSLSGNIDISAIEAAITPRTKGITVVHFLGVPVNVPRVVEIARRHGLFVLEDCALAMGTYLDGIHAGLLGDAGAFSFYPVKHMTTSEGGMVITKDGELAADIRLKRAFGVDRAPHERTMPGIYDVPALGFNYRMSEIEAALGSVQLRRMEEFLKARRRNNAALRKAIADIPGITAISNGGGRFTSSLYCLSILLDQEIADRRPQIVERLKALGVGTSVYYPKPVPAMAYYRDRYGYDPALFPNAARIADASIALPVGPHLDEAAMNHIGATLRQTITEVTL